MVLQEQNRKNKHQTQQTKKHEHMPSCVLEDNFYSHKHATQQTYTTCANNPEMLKTATTIQYK